MIHFDFDDNIDKEQGGNELLTCSIHGEYPASLRSFGCPECAHDELDEDELEDWRNRQARKGGYRDR